MPNASLYLTKGWLRGKDDLKVKVTSCQDHVNISSIHFDTLL